MSSPAAGESAAAGYAKTLVDDVVREILLRLPSSTVLRSRAVCRTWNRLTTESSFLAAHAERQPAELLVVSGKQPSSPHLDTIPLSLQAVEVVEGRRSHLHYPEHCEVRAMLCSCDGLLLFHRCGCRYFLCNPVTRQGIRLDLMPPTCGGRSVRMCGFYRHGPSGEHRLLVLVNEGRTGPAAHYVFSLAAAAASQQPPPPRCLGPVADGVLHEICFNVLNPHVHHRGKLYSTMHPVARSADKIMSFDTVSGAFRLISRPPWPRDRYRCPPESEDICLLELDGMLALTVTVTVTAADPTELWVLEDYENDQSWSHRFRIDVTPSFCASWATDTGVPDVILVGSYTQRFVALYHLTEKRIVKQIELVNDSIGTSGHFLFKDSLVQYDFLDPY